VPSFALITRGRLQARLRIAVGTTLHLVVRREHLAPMVRPRILVLPQQCAGNTSQAIYVKRLTITPETPARNPLPSKPRAG
jgi:hypothetical protein